MLLLMFSLQRSERMNDIMTGGEKCHREKQLGSWYACVRACMCVCVCVGSRDGWGEQSPSSSLSSVPVSCLILFSVKTQTGCKDLSSFSKPQGPGVLRASRLRMAGAGTAKGLQGEVHSPQPCTVTLQSPWPPGPRPAPLHDTR